MPSPRFADVALPLPIEHPLTYKVPDSLQHRILPGMRVIVPIQKKVMTGYVTAVHQTSTLETDTTRGIKLLSVIDLPDAGPIFTQEMMDLSKWLSNYYCCSVGQAMQCAVPSGINIKTKKRYTLLTDQLSAGRFSDRQRKIVAELYRRGPLTSGQLARAVGAKALSNSLQSLVKRGILLEENLVADTSVSIKTEMHVRLVEDKIPGHDDLVEMQRRAPKQAAVYLDLLHGEPERRATELYEKHKANPATVKALVKKGLLSCEDRELLRAPEIAAVAGAQNKLTLNAEQQRAHDQIVSATDNREFQTFLLHGITGSGKTEVYLQVIEKVLKQGRDAIILVPEISLTPQTVGRFIARFKQDIAVLHSGLGAGERYDEWRRAQRGDVRIVVGARSAVFAPLPDVGIIIVDEEHDTSYKQTDTPRYHARDVAVMRAKSNNGVCVLGSATPSVESYYNSERGKSTRLELVERATKAKLPEVEILDMRIETRETGGQVLLSRKLEKEVTQRVNAGEQVILLLNRRGHSPFVLCPQCGWVASCNDCQVSLTYHASGGYLNCHYCNARKTVPQVCDECHFNPLIFMGVGTQKIEDYLKRSFPSARIERMDADSTSQKGGHARILGRFADGQIDILVGTQMIAKGHDYPGVTLVGVLNADSGLNMPDFRASENTFQLLTQVAGRAGRGNLPGKVIVQTYRPNHFAIAAAANHDYTTFFAQEIHYREGAAYPPLRRMANYAIESEDHQLAERATAALHRLVRQEIKNHDFQGVEILGPSPATIRRVKKKYRWNLAALSKSTKRLNTLARATKAAFTKEFPSPKVQLKIDIDPYGMF